MPIPSPTSRTRSAAAQKYDRLTDQYDRRWRGYIHRTLRKAIEAADLTPAQDVLDIPCGTGEMLTRLLHDLPNLRPVGGDLSFGMLQHARDKPALAHVPLVQADAAALPFRDHSFDRILCANSFHYFPTPDRALAEFHRLLRPAGLLVLVDWCDDYLACKLFSRWLRYADPAFHRTYSLDDSRDMLEAAGFTVPHAERFRAGRLWGMMCLVAQRT